MNEDITTPTTDDAQSITSTESSSVDTSADDAYEMPSADFSRDSEQSDDDEQQSDEAPSDDIVSDDDEIEDTPAPSDETTTVEIDGQQVPLADVREAIKAAQNKGEWQRAFTQRDQEFRQQQRDWQSKIEQQISKGQSQDQDKAEFDAMSPEEKQTAQWLKQSGWVRQADVQRMIQEAITPFKEQVETIRQTEGSRQILSEAQDLMEKHHLSEDEVLDVAEFARDNKLAHLPLYDSWVLMNKDNITAANAKTTQAQKEKIAARKQIAGRSLKTSGGGSPTDSKDVEYDPSKHRGLSYSELAAL